MSTFSATASFPDIDNSPHYWTILNPKTRPKEFGKIDYDIHVYYDSLEEREVALSLRESMKEAFADKHFYAGEMIDIPIGPHGVPQWEGNFQKDLLSEVFLWLNENRGDLKILLHPFTADPLWDHTTGAVFFGHGAAANVNAPFLEQLMKKK